MHGTTSLENVTCGVWDDQLELVEIKLLGNKPRITKFYGFAINQNVYLHIEEAIALMDHGILEVLHGNSLLSIQDLYGIAMNLNDQFIMQRITVYLELFRLGYILMRANIYCKLKGQSLDLYPEKRFSSMYFLWLPNQKEKFKKSSPVNPDNCLIVSSASSVPLSVEEFKSCRKALFDLSPSNPPRLLLSIVDSGNTISWIECEITEDIPDIRALD